MSYYEIVKEGCIFIRIPENEEVHGIFDLEDLKIVLRGLQKKEKRPVVCKDKNLRLRLVTEGIVITEN